MNKLSDNQYFLIIPQLNIFPELEHNSVKMSEQIMNALLLISNTNIYEGINNVLEFEKIAKLNLNITAQNDFDILTNFLQEFGLSIMVGEQVRLLYPKYHNELLNYREVSKQKSMNLEFALQKKLQYDGFNIILENTFITWVYELLNTQFLASKYNHLDKLIYHFIEPRATLKQQEIREIIKEETESYINEYRKSNS